MLKPRSLPKNLHATAEQRRSALRKSTEGNRGLLEKHRDDAGREVARFRSEALDDASEPGAAARRRRPVCGQPKIYKAWKSETPNLISIQALRRSDKTNGAD